MDTGGLLLILRYGVLLILRLAKSRITRSITRTEISDVYSRISLDAKVGDIVIGYEANPVKKIVALAKDYSGK